MAKVSESIVGSRCSRCRDVDHDLDVDVGLSRS